MICGRSLVRNDRPMANQRSANAAMLAESRQPFGAKVILLPNPLVLSMYVMWSGVKR